MADEKKSALQKWADAAGRADRLADIRDFVEQIDPRPAGFIPERELLASDLAFLLAELAAAKKDGERLDLLEREAHVEPLLLHDGRSDTNGHRGLGLMPGNVRRSLREAIDQFSQASNV